MAREQEMEDDEDLKKLKEKIKYLKEQKPPEDKDELINHLSERLQSAEEAIFEAEEAISHERSYRKRITQELKDKNAELRQLVENEKKKLSDKIHEELEVTLKQALKEKMAAEDSLAEAKAVMVERDMVFEEVDGLFLTLRDEHKSSAKITADQQKVIEHLEEELQ